MTTAHVAAVAYHCTVLCRGHQAGVRCRRRLSRSTLHSSLVSISSTLSSRFNVLYCAPAMSESNGAAHDRSTMDGIVEPVYSSSVQAQLKELRTAVQQRI